MSISFKCFACDKPLRVADGKQGKRIKCPDCSTVVTVPDEDEQEIEEVERSRHSQKSVRGKSKRSKAKSSGVYPLIWVGIAGVSFVAIGLIVSSMTRNHGDGTPVVDKAAAERSQDENRLKMLGLAMQHYHDANRQYPIADVPENFGADGKPLLSWRVHLLPYLSQPDLHKQFHLNEPWDSPHNKELIGRMPDVFQSGNTSPPNTRMLTLNGPHGLFFQRNVGIQHITDGASNTILIVQVGPDKAIPWTKPDDIVVDPPNLLASFGKIGQTFLCVMADGNVREIDSTVDAKSLAEIATAHGGQAVDFKRFTTISESRRAPPKSDQIESARSSLSSPLLVDNAAERSQDSNRLSTLALAMHKYYLAHNQYAIADLPENFDADGKPLLSWRVHLLPYLSQVDLHKQFHLTEAWDSPHNITLIDRMPDVFRSGNTKGPNTSMLTLNGPHGLFFRRNVGYLDITDGSSNTILIVQVGPNKAIPWTKPDDIIVEPPNLLASFGNIGPTFLCATAEAGILEIDSTIDEKSLAALATPGGGEFVDFKRFTTISNARREALNAAKRSPQSGP